MTYQPSPDKPLGLNNNMPIPKWQVGQKVIYCPRQGDFTFWENEYRSHLTKYWLDVCNRSRKKGEKKHKKLPAHLQKQVDKMIEVFHNHFDKEVVIAGIIAHSGFNVDTEGFNACYVGGVPGASSPTRQLYQILMYYKVENNTCALITGIGIGGNHDFKEVEEVHE